MKETPPPVERVCQGLARSPAPPRAAACRPVLTGRRVDARRAATRSAAPAAAARTHDAAVGALVLRHRERPALDLACVQPSSSHFAAWAEGKQTARAAACPSCPTAPDSDDPLGLLGSLWGWLRRARAHCNRWRGAGGCSALWAGPGRLQRPGATPATAVSPALRVRPRRVHRGAHSLTSLACRSASLAAAHGAQRWCGLEGGC